MLTRAICRTPGADFGRGLTTANLGPADYATMLTQHAVYVEALRSVGLEVEVLEPAEGFPDAYFVEDVAVVTPEIAVLARPGAPARRGEEATLEPALARHREVERIAAPGTLDGGDVLIVGREVFVGVTDRTNLDGAAQLGRILAPFGYATKMIRVPIGLHLKSSVTCLDGNLLLMSEEFASRPELRDYSRVVVPMEERYAANALWVNGALLHPRGFPQTRARLDGLGVRIIELDTSESRKMDGAMTCMSIRF